MNHELPTVEEAAEPKPFVDMIEVVRADVAHDPALEGFVTLYEEKAEEKIQTYGRMERRQGERIAREQHVSNIMTLAAGYLSAHIHPILRERKGYEFIRPIFVNDRKGSIFSSQLTQGAVLAAQGFDAYRAYQPKIEAVVDAMDTDEQHAHMLWQYAEPIRETEEDDVMLADCIWRYAFTFSYGAHKEDSLLTRLTEKVAAGGYDGLFAKELLQSEDQDSESNRLMELAQYLSNGQDQAALINKLSQRLDLLGPDFMKLVQGRRATLLHGIQQTNQMMVGLLGRGPEGISGNLSFERERVRQEYREVDLRRKTGQAILEHGQRSLKKRVRPTERESGDGTVSSPEAADTPRPAIPVNARMFDYKSNDTSKKLLADTLQEYTGENQKLKEAIESAIQYISTEYGGGKRGNGIKKITRSSDKQYGLWRFSPAEAAGFGGPGRIMSKTRLLFVHKDNAIHIVDIVGRDHFEAALASIGVKQ